MHLGIDSFVSAVTDPATERVIGPEERMEHLLEEIALGGSEAEMELLLETLADVTSCLDLGVEQHGAIVAAGPAGGGKGPA